MAKNLESKSKHPIYKLSYLIYLIVSLGVIILGLVNDDLEVLWQVGIFMTISIIVVILLNALIINENKQFLNTYFRIFLLALPFIIYFLIPKNLEIMNLKDLMWSPITQTNLNEYLVLDMPLKVDGRNKASISNVPVGKSINSSFTERGITLSGDSSYLEIPNYQQINFNNNQDFSISVWINVNSNQIDESNEDNDIIEKWGSKTDVDKNGDNIYRGYPFTIRYQRTKKDDHSKIVNKISFARHGYSKNSKKSSGVLTKNQVELNKFNMYIFLKKNDNLIIYRNGELDSEYAKDELHRLDLKTSNPHNLFIGCRGGSANFFKGNVSDLQIFDKALTEKEIRYLYKNSKEKYEN